MTIVEDARHMQQDLVRFRHELHREPEIGLDLPRTQEKVLANLQDLPLEITLGKSLTSIGAVLRGTGTPGAGTPGGPGRPVVLLRGDMDALPVQERTGVDFSSRVDGAMHACGHDLHTAMLAGAARLLAGRRDRLAGDVVLMFQPGEEGCNGAGIMLDEGILDIAGRRADAAFGMHVFSGLVGNGRFVTKPGTIMSASDTLIVTVRGEGGHGSAPHHAKDPVTAVAEMVTALQVAVTRQFNMLDPIVISVGLLRAGSASNVIPDSAYFEATVRTFSTASRDRIQEAAPRLLTHIARAHGLEADVEFRPRYPVTVNNADEALFAQGVAAELFGDGRSVRLEQSLSASEDFSRVLQAVPGAFVGLGATTPGQDPDAAPFNHSPFATFDDGVLADGAALYAELAEARLNQLATEGHTA
jgi:amidohydrolase